MSRTQVIIPKTFSDANEAMLQSMTAYASHTMMIEDTEVLWSCRSVNHRYLDVQIRLPEHLQCLENCVRKRVAAHLHRGRVEIQLSYSALASQQDFKLNEVLLAKLLRTSESLPLQALSVADVLRWPGILDSTQYSSEQQQQQILQALDKLLDEVVQMRQQEAQALTNVIQQRLVIINHHISEISAEQPLIEQTRKEKLAQRLAEVSDSIEPNRMAQELVYWAQKSDINEELERLQTHVAAVHACLVGDDVAVGRKLDFLMQELNREVNTLAAKSVSAATSAAAVELKVLIEQIREQIQNLV